VVYDYYSFSPTPPSEAQSIASKFSFLPQVVAIALAGSQTAKVSDNFSDLDFYIYIQEEIPLDIRTNIGNEFADRIEINNQFWEPGDEWSNTSCGYSIDIMYRNPTWIEQQLDRVLVKHQASVGFSTCFWWNVLTSIPLYDQNNWLTQLKVRANQPYPEPLRQAIVAKNYPILRNNISSYMHQLELAILRNDFISINHRVTALLSSYFDIIFAINYVAHPGEKRLVEHAKKLCSKLPHDMELLMQNLIQTMSLPLTHQRILEYAHKLIDTLDELLVAEGLLTKTDHLTE
jgi:hypothetical protein